jgi:hypothetical protein
VFGQELLEGALLEYGADAIDVPGIDLHGPQFALTPARLPSRTIVTIHYSVLIDTKIRIIIIRFP